MEKGINEQYLDDNQDNLNIRKYKYMPGYFTKQLNSSDYSTSFTSSMVIVTDYLKPDPCYSMLDRSFYFPQGQYFPLAQFVNDSKMADLNSTYAFRRIEGLSIQISPSSSGPPIESSGILGESREYPPVGFALVYTGDTPPDPLSSSWKNIITKDTFFQCDMTGSAESFYVFPDDIGLGTGWRPLDVPIDFPWYLICGGYTFSVPVSVHVAYHVILKLYCSYKYMV